MNDDNWYHQDEPTRRDSGSKLLTWTLIGAGSILALSTMVAMVLYLPQKLRQGFDNLVIGEASFDDSQPVTLDESSASERRAQAASAVASDQVVGPGVSSADADRVRQSLTALHEALQTDDDTAFEALLDKAEFERRVTDADSLSLTGRAFFRQDFPDWMAYYRPAVASRMPLAAIRVDGQTGDLVAYTWVYSGSEFCSRFAWHFHQDPAGNMRLADYEDLDRSALYSDRIAREFSAACTGSYWDNYLAPQESEVYSLSGDAIDDELIRLADLPIAASVAQWGLLDLANTAWSQSRFEVCLKLVERVKARADVPLTHWLRATSLWMLDRNAEALESLQEFESRVGSGPEVWLLRGQLLQESGLPEGAANAFLKSLTIDPDNEYFPVTFHSTLPPSRAEDLAAVVRRSVAPVERACRLATDLLNINRDDLAEPLIAIARSAPQPTAAVFALEATVAGNRGDTSEQIAKLTEAVRMTATFDDSFWMYHYTWLQAMADEGRHADAVRQSPEPSGAFETLAFEDGELTVSTETLKQMVAALKQATPIGADAIDQREMWISIADPLISLQARDFETAWQGFRDIATLESAQLEESDTGWMVNSWLAASAAHSGHVAEAYQLLTATEDPFYELITAVQQRRSAPALTELIALEAEHNPSNTSLAYYQAIALEYEDRTDAASVRLSEFLRDTADEPTWQSYDAQRRLVRIAMQRGGWKDLLDKLPPETAYEALSTAFRAWERPEQMHELLELPVMRPLDRSLTLEDEVWLRRWKQEWPELLELAGEWQSTGLASQFDPEEPWATQQLRSALFDAMLMAGQFDAADEFLNQFSKPTEVDERRLRLAVIRSESPDTPELQQLTLKAAEEGYSFPMNEVTDAMFWSQRWQQFRRQNPPYLWEVAANSLYSQVKGVVLLPEPVDFDAAFLQQSLATLDQEARVEELTEAQQAAISQIRSAANDNSAFDAATVQPARFFRVSLNDDTTVLVSLFAGRYADDDSADGGLTNVSEHVRTSYSNHRGFISVVMESKRPGLGDRQSAAVIAKTLAAVSPQNAPLLLLLNSSLTPLTDAVRRDLQNGLLNPFEESDYVAIWPFSDWYDAIGRTSVPAQRLLAAKLTNLPEDAADPDIHLWLHLASAEPSLPVRCRLIRWSPPYGPTSLVVELPDSPLVAPAYRGEYVRTFTGSVLSWTDGTAATSDR